MPVRLLGYDALLLEHLIRQHQLAADGVLPPIIALVILSGLRRWQSPLELRELFAPVPEDAARLLPALSYLLIAPAHLDAEALDQPDNLAAAFFRITEARAPEELLCLAGPLSRMLAGKKEAELRRAFIDLMADTLRSAFPEVTIPYVKDLEELSMLEENMIRWRKSVLREGHLEGRKEGEVEGMRRVLRKQMELRFGSLPLQVRRRIREISSMAELEDLAGRLLTATSLSDLGLETPTR
jgi:hypothetical protein